MTAGDGARDSGLMAACTGARRDRPALIGVDWGSSSFRAYLMARDGAILDALSTADGVASVPRGGFPATFRRLLGAWLDAHPPCPSSPRAWSAAATAGARRLTSKCPADPRAIAEKLVAVEADGRRVLIVPGLVL